MRKAFFVVLLVTHSAFGLKDNRDKLNDVLALAKPGTVAVFDLDDTIFSLRPRMLAVIQNFAKLPETKVLFPKQSEKVQNDLKLHHLGYGTPSELLKGIGLEGSADKPFLKALDKYWEKTFFSNAIIANDAPVPGAIRYVRALYDKGTHIIYLTGRDFPGMGEGTKRQIAEHGLPLGERADLVMKPEFKMPDVLFKEQAVRQIRGKGNVIGVYDNEPENILALNKAFPTAKAFFVDQLHSGKSMDVLIKKGEILWVPDFTLLAD